jgi:L-iditol 2-dehydrogenase
VRNEIHCEHFYNYEQYTELKEGNAPYAQYLLKPSWLLQKIPDGVSYEKASLVCCGLGPTFGVCQALQVTAFDKQEESLPNTTCPAGTK